MGRGVFKASASSIGIRFMLHGRNERVFIPQLPTARNLKLWESKREVIKSEIGDGTFQWSRWFPWLNRDTSQYTIETMLNDWLRHVGNTLERTTYKKESQIVDCTLIPAWGRIKAGAFHVSHVLDWLDEHPHLARKTVSNYLSPLRRAFVYAVEKRHMDANPLVGFSSPVRLVDKERRRVKTRDADPFLPAEIQKVCDIAQPDMAVFAQVNCWTGLRLEEMLELHIEDLDFHGGRIWVHRARVRLIVKGVKTPSSERYVTLLPGAVQSLRDALKLSYMQGEHVFICLRTGRPWSEDSLRNAWKRRVCVQESATDHQNISGTHTRTGC